MQIVTPPFADPSESPGFLNRGGYLFSFQVAVAAVAADKGFFQLWYPATTFPGATLLGFELFCSTACTILITDDGTELGSNTVTFQSMNNGNFAPTSIGNTGAQAAAFTNIIDSIALQANTPYRSLPGWQYIYGGGFQYGIEFQCQTADLAFQVRGLFAEPPV